MSYWFLIKKGLSISMLCVYVTLVLSVFFYCFIPIEATVIYILSVAALCVGHLLVSGPLAVKILKRTIDD